MLSSRPFKRSVTIGTLLSLMGVSVAYSEGHPNASFDGFVSLGNIDVSANSFLGDTESAALIEAGIRGSYRLSNQLTFSAQAVYRESGDITENQVNLDFFKLDWRDNLWEDSEQVISLGRFKTTQGLYNTTRDVPFTRPTVLLPQSIYFDSIRTFFLSTDGISLSTTEYLDIGELRIELAGGAIDIGDSFNNYAIGPNIEGNWNKDEVLYADVRLQTESWLLAAQHNRTEVSYTPAPGDSLLLFGQTIPLSDGEFQMASSLLSVQKSLERWELSAEYSRRNIDFEGFSVQVINEQVFEGYYLQSRFFLNDRWTLVARYDHFVSNANDRRGDRFAQVGLSRSYASTIDRTLGATWRPNSSWMIAFEFHQIDGAAWLPSLAFPDIAGNPRPADWSLSAVQVSYRF